MNWYSPFNLSNKLITKLKSAGFKEITDSQLKEVKEFILIYDTPDQLVSDTLIGENVKESYNLLEGYNLLLSLKSSSNLPLLNGSHLINISKKELIECSKNIKSFDEKLFKKRLKFIDEDNYIIYFVINFLQISPEIINGYLDCELNCNLMGRDPDINYEVKVNSISERIFLLKNLRKFIANQENLKKIYISNIDKVNLLENQINELEKMDNSNVKKINLLENQLKDLKSLNERNQESSRLLEKEVKEYKTIYNNNLEKIQMLEKEKSMIGQHQINDIRNELNQFIIQSDVYKNQLSLLKTENDSLKMNIEKINNNNQVSQEDLEKYFLENDQLNQLNASQSREINRAQNLISRLLTFYEKSLKEIMDKNNNKKLTY